MSKENLVKCRQLLEEVGYHGITYTTDEILSNMLFKPGSSRLQLLKWLFTEMFMAQEFNDEKLSEELTNFALRMGFCCERDKVACVLGEGKDATTEVQFKFWQLVLESVRDMQSYNAQDEEDTNDSNNMHSELLKSLVASGKLQSYLSASKNINICPELIDSKSVRPHSNTNFLQSKLGKAEETLEDVKLKNSVAMAEFSKKTQEKTVELEDLKARVEAVVNLCPQVKQISIPESRKDADQTDPVTEALSLAAQATPAFTQVLANEDLISNFSKDQNITK